MSKVILYIATSIDGFIADKDGGVTWLDQFNDGSGEDYGYTKFTENIDANIQGANTYQQVLDFDVAWPYESKSYVVSHKELDLPEKGEVEFYSGDLKELVQKVKSESKKDIWLIGGAHLANQFIKLGILDEVIISVMPVILGSGIPLFSQSNVYQKAELLNSSEYSSGAVQLHYAL